MRFVWLLWLVVTCCQVVASGPSVRFERLTVDDGLSQNTVRQIVQDHQGFLWLATDDGLNRYDGYEFKVYRPDPDNPRSLNYGHIWSLLVDDKGTLWVGTAKGLHRYRPDSDDFDRFLPNDNQQGSLPNGLVRSLYQDKAKRLWVGTYGGLALFNDETEQFTVYAHDPNNPSSLASNKVRTILDDSSGNLWVGTDGGGISILMNGEQYFRHFQYNKDDETSISNNRIRSLSWSNTSGMWVGTYDGLNNYDEFDGKFKRYQHAADNPFSLPNNRALTMLNDRQNRLWVGTLAGVSIFQGGQWTFLTHQHDSGNAKSLSDNNVWSIFEDNNGVIWVGTANGLNQYNVGNDLFIHYTQQSNDPKSLKSTNVMSIYQTKNKSLWVGPVGGGLNRFNDNGETFEHFVKDPNRDNSISDNRVFAMLEGFDGKFWVGTANGLNLMKKDEQGNFIDEFERFLPDKNDISSLSHNLVSALVEDSQGDLWVGTYGGGLNRFNRESNTFEQFRANDYDDNSLSHDVIRGLYQDREQNLWIGTIGGGLNRYNYATREFEHFRHDPNDDKSISHDAVGAIYQDTKGRLWITTEGGGFNRYDGPEKGFKRYRKQQGLINDTVYGVLEDNQGWLWFSTNKGLSRFNPETEQFRYYDMKDGLQSNEFNGGAFWRLHDGELVFGGVNGFNRFYPEKIVDDPNPPLVAMTDFYLFNQAVEVNKPAVMNFSLDKTIGEIGHFTLNYKQNLMSIAFTGLHFANASRNQYKYMLQGYDKDWIYTDAKMRRATYTNIPAGDYRFVVEASNKDGVWSEQGAFVDISITPPPWKTWWAYSIYTILFVLSIVLTIRAERKKVAKERAIVAELRKVDKLKDEFLANTSHELRTPLNGIIGIAESLIDGVAGKLPPLADRNLGMVVSSGRRLADLVNDILDFSKLTNANLELFTKPLDIFEVVDVVLTLSRPAVVEKPLTLHNDVPQGLPAVLADEDRLHQILHNLVGNAIKFTERGEVRVTAQVTKVGMLVTVQDTGIGIEQDKFDDIFKSFEQVHGSAERKFGGTGLGLAVCKQLVELHDGQISVDSKLGVGSNFSFTLPVTDLAAIDTSVAHAAKLHLLEKEDDATADAEPEVAYFEQLKAESKSDDSVSSEHLDGSGFSILIVDDEPINRQVLHNHLFPHNYQLVEAPGGQEAVQIIQDTHDNGQHFDLILLDIMMPNVSGYDVCKLLRQLYPVNDLPVIFLTAKNQVTDLVQSFAVGANDYLSKPVSKHELITRVETHLKLLDINRNLEDKVAKRTEELERATQAKSDFLAKMSHEIRTPINAVIGLSRLTLKSGLAHQQRDYVEKVVDAGEALLGLINDILDFSKIEAGKLTIEQVNFSLESLVQRSINLSAMNAHSKGLELICEIAPEIPDELYGDPLRLQQIVVNLINNAVKFTEKGFVYIRAQVNEDLADKMLLQFSVRDSGIGMSAEQQLNLFQSFSQADDSVTRKYGGTGLGLAISKQLAELMGGEIWLESEVDQGSTFHFTVMVDKPKQYQRPLLSLDVSRLRVLLISESALCLQVVANLFSEINIEVVEVSCDEQAHAEMTASYADKTPFDLVMIDWRIGPTDGIATIKQLEQVCVKKEPMPYVVMSSTYDKDEVRSGLTKLSLGHNPLHRIIEKPVVRSSLWQTLNWIFGKGDEHIDGEQALVEQVPNFSSSNILLVEDNAINRQVAMGFLDDTLVKVDIAENGQLALDKLRNKQYDLVLMDIQMPIMDGISAAKAIRQELQLLEVPIIAMTAHAMEADVQRSLQAGMNSHITKPLDPHVLYKVMGEYLTACELPAPKVESAEIAESSWRTASIEDLDSESWMLQQLESVSGLDAQTALARMNGRTALYLGLVKDFEQQQKSLSQVLLGLFDDEQWQVLYRSIHSLKSNAAYIGAYKLAQIADRLEKSLSEGQYDKESLLHLCELLRAILEQLSGIYPQQQETLEQAFTPEKLKQMLEQMMPLLESSDIEVEEQLPSLNALCQGSQYQQTIECMIELIDDVEYEQAVDIARSVLDDLAHINA